MNTKMKVLSLALVGLAGFAGSAMAACPAGPTTADGGAWTSASQLPSPAGSPLLIATGGLDGSECKLTAALQANSTSAASFVRHQHANPEPSYRFQFLVDTTSLTGFSASTNVVLFQGAAGTVANNLNRVLRVSLVPGAAAGTHRVRFVVQTGAGSFSVGQSSPTDLTAGVHRIEGNLKVAAGADGKFDYWIDAPAGTTEPARTGGLDNLNNAAWGGVNAVTLGLSVPAVGYVTAHGGEAVGFDRFDSRRNTYIGH